MRARKPLVTLLLAVTALAAGCDNKADTSASHPTSAPAVAGFAEATPSSAVPVPSASVTETADPAQGSLFVTPSRNIGCGIFSSGARCDIATKSWTPPPKPSSCEFDWGFGLTVSDNEPGKVSCASDSALGGSGVKVLAYGHAVRAGNVVCTSSEAGVRCENTGSHHGFTLAKEAYTLF